MSAMPTRGRLSRRVLARGALLVSAAITATLLRPATAPATVTAEWRQEAEAFATKSTGAQFSDANASGGVAWNLWTNGYLQTTFTAATSGAKQVDIVARGDVAAGVWPIMRVWVDGTLVSEQSVTGTKYSKQSTTLPSVTAGNHTLKIEFGNDALVGGEDRNLKVDVVSVVPSGIEEWRQEAESFPTKTTGAQASDSSASGSAYWNLWGNGHLETTLTAETSGTKQIKVPARGDVAGGIWPNMRISVDGIVIANHTVGTTTWQTYTTTTTLSKGSHVLRVQFTNDGVVGTEDRNLKVDVASLVPVANEWKQEAEAFTTKTAGAATASSLASSGTFWNLWSNGHLTTTMNAASAGRKDIQIIARGAPAAGVFPNVKVWLGTTLLTTLTVSDTTFSKYSVPATMGSGANTLKLEYVNDATINGEDRNVHLDVVTLVGDNAFPLIQGVPSPASNSYVPAQPALRVLYADPDGDAGFADFEVYTHPADALAASGRSASTAAGDVASWTPPALVHGQQYRWRARAYDGTSYACAWTANQYFTVDSAAPNAPSVTSATFPSGSWSGTNATSGSFTFGTAGSTDVAGYKYGLDTGRPVIDTTDASLSLMPGEGPHRLYVQSVDRAGNLSPVTEYVFNVGAGVLRSPEEGASTAKRFVLRTTADPVHTGVTYQWRRGGTDAWATVPAAHVTSGGNAVTWPVALSAGSHGDLVWDAAATVGGIDGPFEVRASYGAGTATTAGTRVTLNQRTAAAATVKAGPGIANLLTGNLTLTETDLSVHTFASDIAVRRTYSSRDTGAGANGSFGPGWTSGLAVDGAVSPFTALTAAGSLRTVRLLDGDSLGFTATSATAFEPQPGAEDLSLSMTAGSSTATDATDDVYELADREGTVTRFTWEGDGFRPTRVTETGSTAMTTFGYETVSGTTRIARAVAPAPAGVSCATPTTTGGCRTLSFDYAPATTPVPGSSGGDYAGRVRSASITAWDPATSAMRTVELARWSYLPSGRLLSAWDPRLPGLKTTYAYDTAGRITSVTPPGEEPYTFAYAAIPGDPDGGRLRSVSRSALAAGTATQTFVYRVPVSGTGSPADLSAGEVARWGQTAAPTDATAVFPPTQVPDDNPATGALPTSYERASVTYLDVSGRNLNLRGPGGGISSVEYDGVGNVVRSLSPSNRAAALSASATDTAAQEALLATRLSDARVYNADGTRLLETFGPEHEVALTAAVTDSLGRAWPAGALVRARMHTVTTYDEGAPAGSGPYDLPTTVKTGARITDTTTDADVRTTTTAYDWALRSPTTVTTDPGGLNLVSRIAYDTATGLPTTSTSPGGTATGSTAHTLVNSYYTAGAHPTRSDCGNRPEWANLRCRTDVAAQPTVTADRPALPSKHFEYDLFHSATTTTEKNGSTVLRTTTVQYDAAHRPWRQSTTATAGEPLPTVETVYGATNGKATETRVIDGTGTVTARIQRAYDSLGRLTSYTDADGNVATTTYDLLSRPVTTDDGKGTQTYHYDDGTERRGLLTRIVDSAAGTFTGAYDLDGRIVTQDLPNGLRATATFDEAGIGTRLSYAKGTSTWLSFAASRSVHGEVATASSAGLSSQEYGYDAVGRLVRVHDSVVGSGCTVRSYTLDAESNRTSLVTRAPDAEGECTTSGAGTTVTSAYDAAARTTTAGYVYDALGRATSVPASDAGGAALTATYYVNDMVRTLTPQDGTTATGVLDPSRDRFRSWTDNGVTKVHHYAADGDSPAWTAEGGTAWTRNIRGFSGLAAVQDSVSGVTLRLANLDGHIVATASADPAATELLGTYESTEFGAPRDGANRRYAWLGADQRPAAAGSGVVLMGVRVYNPATGRFLQTDPVTGGSANAYDYGWHDPVNNRDLDGRWSYDMHFNVGYTATGANNVFSQFRGSFGNVFPVSGRAATLSHVGQEMNLNFYKLPGWVRVSEIWSNGWKFATRPLHPDYPGTVWFRINQSGSYLTLQAHADVPSYAPIFALTHLCAPWLVWSCQFTEWEAYKFFVKNFLWNKFASNLSAFVRDRRL